MLSTKLKEAAGNSADATLYVDDVFSTWLYTGNGATQTITNGIDLAGKGGLVWLKFRAGTNTASNELFDTVRGVNKLLMSNGTQAENTPSNALNSFNSNGFTLGGNTEINFASDTYVSWTFRKAAKFFDVVTYTGTGSARTIAHSLGVAPGMIIVKQTNSAGAWAVYHRGAAASGQTAAGSTLYLNTTAAVGAATTYWNNTAPTDSVFSVGTNGTTNGAGQTYVAYLFAHDTSSTGIIQCGSFTTDGSGNATVNLGWEPQFFLTKCASDPGFAKNWSIYDTMRGWVAQPSSAGNFQANLVPNTSAAESTGNTSQPKSTGANIEEGIASQTFIYMAIRRPNKPPTSGTQVYNANTAGTAEANTAKVGFYSGFPVDMVIYRENKTNAANDTKLYDRLRGSGRDIRTNTTGAEGASTFPLDASLGSWNTALATDINKLAWMFKRAPGFFDVVCYTGTGVTRTVAHNLTVVPELMIVKERSVASRWVVYHSVLGNTKYIALNESGSPVTSNMWNNTTPTNAVFSVGVVSEVNSNSETYVAYLFATLAGISKVGSYTGNGTSQNINCGFAAGARFFLVKATSTTGSWWVWDSARGITAGNDPALQLNSTAAEITTADAVDPYSPGITVYQEATCSINANGVSYIFLAVA